MTDNHVYRTATVPALPTKNGMALTSLVLGIVTVMFAMLLSLSPFPVSLSMAIFYGGI